MGYQESETRGRKFTLRETIFDHTILGIAFALSLVAYPRATVEAIK